MSALPGTAFAPASPFTPVDARSFREAMARLCSPVTILTSNGQAGLAGCTASAVCSITDDPPTLFAVVNRNSRNNAIIRANGRLCVNVLDAVHENLARRFADGELSINQRFEGSDWLETERGLPALGAATAAIDCRIDKIEEVGTHSVFFCVVEALRLQGDSSGLAYLGRQFHAISRHQRRGIDRRD